MASVYVQINAVERCHQVRVEVRGVSVVVHQCSWSRFEGPTRECQMAAAKVCENVANVLGKIPGAAEGAWRAQVPTMGGANV